ncbi:PAAR domain-containing protein [Nannocystaceae bacterium ST9]
MSLAARVTDAHTCPAWFPLPHVGGVITGPGIPTVLIGSMPAAVQGTVCTCAFGPPNPIASGSTTVQIGSMPAARMGDPTSHGGSIVAGCPTVLIGG